MIPTVINQNRLSTIPNKAARLYLRPKLESVKRRYISYHFSRINPLVELLRSQQP